MFTVVDDDMMTMETDANIIIYNMLDWRQRSVEKNKQFFKDKYK